MTSINFGGIVEEIVTREEFPLEKARQVLKDERIAVLGYGVQGPAQALNMRENGFNVIIGLGLYDYSWEKALADGWVEGETLFNLEKAVQRATIIQYLVSDAAQKMRWPEVKAALKEGDALCFSHGAKRFWDQCARQLPGWQRDQFQLCHPSGFYRSGGGTYIGARDRDRFGLSFPDHI
jgi:ketol-acid reductoisomerase